jgi:ABC-type nitrate/sulfonate/bicarbonate transport system permease component
VTPRSVDASARWLPLVVVLAGTLAWEAAARLGVIPSLFFPPPSAIARALVRMLVDGDLGRHVGATLARVLAGAALGGLPGLLVGLLMGWSRRVRAALDPMVAAIHPLPKIALFPLVLILLGLGETPKLVIIALGAFFPMLVSTMAGVRQISPICFEVAQNYGASRTTVLTRVVIPGSLPLALAGARLALNLALTITIAVELLAADRGIGAIIWSARETLRLEELYVGLAAAAALGLLFNGLLRALAARLTPWQPERIA